MASIDPNEINITDEQHEEQKNSNDKLYEGQKDSTKKSPAEQISSEDHWRKWLESRNIKVIVSIDADTTKNGTVEAFCKTLVDILPAHTLLCAGKKDEAIDKIIGAEFKNHKTTTINRKDGEKSRDNQTDAKKCGLSMYYRQNRFLFENDKGYQKSSSPKDIHKMLQKNIHKTKTSINIIHIDFAGESAEECSGIEKKITENEIITEKQYKISHEAKKVPMDELLERLENIKMKPDKIEDNNPIYFGTKEMAEDQRCGLIGISILKCLMSAWHNRNEEEMVNIFKEQLLNDKDLLKEIVNQAFKGKIQTLKFDGVINESWIDNFIKKASEDSKEHKRSNTDNISLTSKECPTSEDSNEHIEMKEIDDFKEFCQTRQEKMRTDKLKDKVLFIWCVSKGISRQVTMEFWERGENKIAMALLAYKVCKHMNNKYEGSEAGEKMSKAMQYYGKLAIKLLGQCFCKDERLTFRLLIGRIPDLLDMTPFDIALDADFKAFIAEKPCRVLLDRFWTKPLSNLGNCYYIRFLVSIIFPLLSPFFMRFNNSWLNEHFEEADDFDEYDSEIEEYAKDDDDEEEDDNMILTIQSIYDEEDDDFNNCFRLLAVVYFYYKFVQFFIGTQTVRFIYNTMSHMSYLILFSYVMLTEFGKDTGLSTPEIILDVWTLVLWIEEIKQAVGQGRDYLDNWNIFDNFGLILFLIGFILRMIVYVSPSTCPECLYTARIVLAFSLMIFILRTLQLLSVHSTLGPAIFMINALLKDLISFMLILAVFVLSYGIGSNIILYPNQPLNVYLFIDILYDSFWLVLQEFNQEESLGLNCNKDETNITAEYCSSTTALGIDYVRCKENKCPANRWIVAILLAIYAIISVVMMLNVLIAMFNTTFSQVQEKKEEVYILQVYRFMREYSLKSVFPIPLCVVSYWHVIPWCIQRCRKEKDQKSKRKLFNDTLPAAASHLESKEGKDIAKKIDVTSDQDNPTAPQQHFKRRRYTNRASRHDSV